MKSSTSLGMLGMLKLDVFFKDNVSTYTVNFDNGKIDITIRVTREKNLVIFLKNIVADSINTDMIKTIPSQDILGVLAINYKPEAIKELIKLIGMDGMLNSYSDKLDLLLMTL